MLWKFGTMAPPKTDVSRMTTLCLLQDALILLSQFLLLLEMHRLTKENVTCIKQIMEDDCPA